MSSGQFVLQDMVDLVCKMSGSPQLWTRFFDDAHVFTYEVNATSGVKEMLSGYDETQKDCTHFAALISLLNAHIHRADRLADQLSLVEGFHERALDMLEQFPVGVVLIDSVGTIRFKSKVASQLLKQHPLIVAESRLSIRNSAVNLKLQQLLKSVGALSYKDTCSHPCEQFVLSVPANDAGETVTMSFVPPRSNAMDASLPLNVCVGVFLRGSKPSCKLSESVLQKVFGMTSAESRLACILVTGCGVNDAANTLNISENTAKSQLRSIYRKTSTSRQAELVYKLLMSPALLSDHSARQSK